MPRRILAIAAFLACLSSAQEFRSTLSGKVTDPSGAVVPNVKVVATKSDTNSRFETVTNTDGLYTLPFLPPGFYALSAEGSGFKKYQQSGLQIGSDTRIGQDIVLAIGANSESVTVTADAAQLESVSASAGQVITTHEVESLPVNGRAPMDLAILGYGVVNTGVRDQNRPFENSGFSTFAMGGAATGANAALLDGVPNIGTLGTVNTRVSFSPPVDSVVDVKVEAFNVDASYGGFGGGTVEVTTKGGTNQLHGSASEFNQVSALAATPFFTNAAGAKKPPYRQNLWSMTVGGPVWVPKVFNGKDKLFFFFTYEGFQDAYATPAYFTVPTAPEIQGDFSRLLSLNNGAKNYTLYDPNTAVLNGSTITRTAFPGNIIPASRLNPIATKFLSTYMPAPNTQGIYDDTNNYLSPENTIDKYHSFSGRSDVNISNKNKLTVSGRQSYWCQTGPTDIVENLAYEQHAICRDLWGGMIDDVHTFSPSFVGDLRLGFNRYDQYSSQPSLGYDPAQLGFPSYIGANSPHLMMSVFTFSDGYAGNAATSAYYINQPYSTYQVFNSFTKIVGSHAIKFGGQALLQDFTSLNWQNSTGGYTFDTGTWVKATSSATAPTLGGSMAQFLMGLPTSGSLDIYSPAKNDSWYDSLFLNDDWHARSNLTINMGLRWEYGAPTTESHNRQSIGFDPTAVNQVAAAAAAAYARNPQSLLPASAFSATGGLLFASADHRAAYTTSHRAFAPRLGLSWSPSSLHNKTVIRAGTGIFYYNYGVLTSQAPGFSIQNQYVATNNSFLTPATTLSNPFPNGIQQPPGAAQGVNTFLGQSVTYYNPSLQNQYSLRWTFDIQQQLPLDTVMEIGYVGNHSVHLTTNYSLTSLPAQDLSTSPFRDNATINALAAIVPNPLSGLLPGTSLSGATAAVSSVVRPFPEFSGVTEANLNNGGSYYHSLNVKLQKRFSRGLQFVINYDHSRLMDSVNYLNGGSPVLEKRVSLYDRPNSFVASGTYDLPFGRGKQFGSQPGNKIARPLDFALGGWSVASVYTLHSGAPLTWGNLLYLGAPLNYNAENPNHAFDTTAFNTVSNQQLSQNYRTFPSQFNNLRVGHSNNIDITLTKTFRIGERVKVQFRAESFNLCNKPLFSGATLSATSSSFGTIGAQSNNPRYIQFGLRLTY
ncbi:MAG TPA: carboxypeptidase-like regulatory domain-containing protein [Candidatus Acidoferrales bacterium]|nr:carboxypeptidase-like regulatory domain-containing protein [Candidatus Acidoferrales bacterium]